MAEFILGGPLRKLARKHIYLRRLLWWLDFAMIWLLKGLFTLVPVDTASRMGERVGAWIGPRLKRKTLIFSENMAIAFPGLEGAELEELVRRAWGQAGRVLAEYPHLQRIFEDPERVQVEVREENGARLDVSRPCVVVSAHLSNWEIVPLAAAKLGIPSAILYSPPTNPLLDQMLHESRRALNTQLLPRDNSTRALMRALKAGRSIGIVMDRRVDDGSPVPFFNQEKCSSIVPAWLAQKFGCELVSARVERLRDANFRVTFFPPVRPHDPEADITERAIDMTAQLHAQFEDWIRQNPQEWFCSKRLWSKGVSAGGEPDGHRVKTGVT